MTVRILTRAPEVLVPLLGSTLMLSEVARRHHASTATIAAIWRDCVAHFHPAAVAAAEAAVARRLAELKERPDA